MSEEQRNESLFSREEEAMARVEALLRSSDPGPTTLREALEALLADYRKLYRQSQRLVTFSDKQQEDLRRLNAENEDYLRRLEALSRTDGLTGVANRRHFDEFLQAQWQRARRGREPLSMIMLDIDRFKLYNDNYGHAAGDECLKRIAAALNEVAKRSSDFFARYGGEEFACILPNTGLEGAEVVARRMRQAVAELALPHAFSDVAPLVTCSFGVACVQSTEDLTPESLLKAADDQLYAAKAQGRNAIRSAVL